MRDAKAPWFKVAFWGVVAIIVIAVLAYAYGCQPAPATVGGPIGPAPPGVTGPDGPAAPGNPGGEGDFTPDPDGSDTASAIVAATIVTSTPRTITTGDVLTVPTLVTAPAGRTFAYPVEVEEAAGGPGWNVLIGQEQGSCGDAAPILGLRDAPFGGLQPSDSFTSWLVDGCGIQIVDWNGPPVGERTVSFDVIGRCDFVGRALHRVFLERKNAPGQTFREPFLVHVRCL